MRYENDEIIQVKFLVVREVRFLIESLFHSTNRNQRLVLGSVRKWVIVRRIELTSSNIEIQSLNDLFPNL